MAAVAAFESGGIQQQAHLNAQHEHATAKPAAAAAGGGAPTADELPLDDSVRCRLSGICDAACTSSNSSSAAGVGSEGPPADDPLACLTSDEERAAAVLDAARHAWGGYRCAAGLVQGKGLHSMTAACLRGAQLLGGPHPCPPFLRRFPMRAAPCSDCAWGMDELQPLSCTGAHWLNLSLTMVDSLDTLYLLGMHHEFEEAAR